MRKQIQQPSTTEKDNVLCESGCQSLLSLHSERAERERTVVRSFMLTTNTASLAVSMSAQWYRLRPRRQYRSLLELLAIVVAKSIAQYYGTGRRHISAKAQWWPAAKATDAG